MPIYVIIIIAVILILLVSIIGIFNRFAKNRNMVNDAWSNIDVILKKRHDLVPNLVNIVKGYATHEQEIFSKVTSARSTAISAKNSNINEQIIAENLLQRSLFSVFALCEDYPDLKANTNFIDLQQRLSDIEENIERSRRYYNSTVRENNTYGESFPGFVFAAMFHYKQFDFFETDDMENMKVDFEKIREQSM